MGTTALDATPVAPRGPALSAVQNHLDAGLTGRHRDVFCFRTQMLWAKLRRPAIGLFLFILSLALYLTRLAPSVVPGDPGEYQLVVARWGIGHPPGYGFYAVVGNLFTHLFPLGTFAWRANVFAAVCAAWMVVLCYSVGHLVGVGPSRQAGFRPTLVGRIRQEFPPVLGAVALATGIGFWQHAIHANAHILTALLAMLTIYCLVRWWRDQRTTNSGSSFNLAPGRRNRWLYVAAFLAGVSPTQHPLLVFAFPAYALFGLVLLWKQRTTAVHPRNKTHANDGTAVWPILTGPGGLLRVMLGITGFGLLGLSFYLYYPIRSAIAAPPPPGPSDMNTWDGFVRVVTAQGLRGNLLGFTFGQIVNRLWDVRVPLRMQFSLPGLVLAGLGMVRLWWPRRRALGKLDPLANALANALVGARRWLVALLLATYLACVILITVNVLQDAVAYLLGPMAVIAILIGIGADVVLDGIARCTRACLTALSEKKSRLVSAMVTVTAALLLALLPVSALIINWNRMDLGSFRDAEDWLAAVEARFVGRGQGAVVLAEWERMTTVYYKRAVEGKTWNEDDLRFIPISAGTEVPFLHAAETYLAQGPVFLTTYRPEVAARYRLAPVPIGRSWFGDAAGWSGTLWQVLPGWPHALPASVGNPADPSGPPWADGVKPIRIVAFAPAEAAEDLEQANPLVEIVGWRLSPDAIHSKKLETSIAQPGDVLALDLYMRLPRRRCRPGPTADGGIMPFYLPWVRLGETTYHFTTDSRFNTPWWQPGEIVIERFELPVPWVLSDPGDAAKQLFLALQVGVQEVSRGRELTVVAAEAANEVGQLISLASVPVASVQPNGRLLRDLDRALGNLRGEILLRGARINGRRVGAGQDEPWVLEPGQKLRVVLEWQSLRPIGDNYKVFVQLLDAGLQVRAQGDDKAPLGGSAPTLLWFPRWRAGTRIADTVILDVPDDLPPGTYPLIVGMYGFSTFKRLPVVSAGGEQGTPVVQGDWITLGHLHVE